MRIKSDLLLNFLNGKCPEANFLKSHADISDMVLKF